MYTVHLLPTSVDVVIGIILMILYLHKNKPVAAG